MIISRYGIKLIRLKQEHIEEVRKWRNAPSISNFMEYREYITKEMQERWFASLNPVKDFYFVIEYNGELVGLIHTSDIDWEKKTGNAGLFVWKSALQGTQVPVFSSLTMVDFFVHYTKLEKLFAKVMVKNKVAIDYNARLGFRLVRDSQKGEFAEYEMPKADYLKKTEELHEFAVKAGGTDYEITMAYTLKNALNLTGALPESLPSDQEEVLTLV